MAELADAHGSGPCESNFMQVQVLLPAPRRNKRKLARSDFFIKIGTHLNRCSSFSEKGHGKSLGSLINALTVALLPTNLFRFAPAGAV